MGNHEEASYLLGIFVGGGGGGGGGRLREYLFTGFKGPAWLAYGLGFGGFWVGVSACRRWPDVQGFGFP